MWWRQVLNKTGSSFGKNLPNRRALAEPMLHLARHPELREHMGRVSAEKIQGHTPEKWAEDFERIVDCLLREKEQ